MNKNEEGMRGSAVRRDIRVLASFIELYCTHKHPERKRERVSAGGRVGFHANDLCLQLCPECGRLFLYAASKRIICPFDPKPSCKKCPAHCYNKSNRVQIREVMRYSGMRMILGGRLGLLIKYFL